MTKFIHSLVIAFVLIFVGVTQANAAPIKHWPNTNTVSTVTVNVKLSKVCKAKPKTKTMPFKLDMVILDSKDRVIGPRVITSGSTLVYKAKAHSRITLVFAGSDSRRQYVNTADTEYTLSLRPGANTVTYRMTRLARC